MPELPELGTAEIGYGAEVRVLESGSVQLSKFVPRVVARTPDVLIAQRSGEMDAPGICYDAANSRRRPPLYC